MDLLYANGVINDTYGFLHIFTSPPRSTPQLLWMILSRIHDGRLPRKKNMFLNVSKVTSKTSSTLFCYPFIAASNFSDGGSGCHGSRNLQNWPGFPGLPRRDCSVETEAPREKTPNLLLVPPPHRRVPRTWCRRERDFERIAVGAFGAWLSTSHRKFERCAARWLFPALGEIKKNVYMLMETRLGRAKP